MLVRTSNPVCGFEVRYFWRILTSIFVDKPGFGRVRSLIFLDFGLNSAHFWLNMFEVQAFWKESSGFKVWLWWMNLGSSEFKVRPVKFEGVWSSFYLGQVHDNKVIGISTIYYNRLCVWNILCWIPSPLVCSLGPLDHVIRIPKSCFFDAFLNSFGRHVFDCWMFGNTKYITFWH